MQRDLQNARLVPKLAYTRVEERGVLQEFSQLRILGVQASDELTSGNRVSRKTVQAPTHLGNAVGLCRCVRTMSPKVVGNR